MLIVETGSEGSARASWLHDVCGKRQQAENRGVPVEGACIHPVPEYSGWEDDRACRTGLPSTPDSSGGRRVHQPLASELRAQSARFSGKSAPQLVVAA